MAAVKAVEDYIRSLDLGAYVVGGAVRDELLGANSQDADFLVPGVDIAALRALLSPHGKTEELVVAGATVGLRFFPRAREVRVLAPAGIELAPSRRERSTGPGRHDFEIVVDPEATVEDDLARRDFTVNAIARRLADGALVDPFGGRSDLDAGILRSVSERSFAEDPLRIVRGLRFVSQLGFDLDERTLGQMREQADSVRLVSGERIGGGLAADGLGELSKLLLGGLPGHALRIARDTGVLVAILPEFEAAIGFDLESSRNSLTLDEHIFAAVQAAAEAATPLRVRLAVLLHDLGKPQGPPDHAAAGAAIADAALRRLRYPMILRERVVAIVRGHAFDVGTGDGLVARRFLQRHFLQHHGDELATDLLDHKQADLRGKRVEGGGPPLDELERLDRFRATVEREQSSPHSLRALAVGGDDLVALGYDEGPEIGRTLVMLLDAVVADPSLNTHEALVARARELLG